VTEEAAQVLRAFGSRIRQLRYAQGWKQVDLAAQLDWKITRSAISYIENGKKSPSLETVIELSQAFGVEPAALLLQPGGDPRHSAANAILGCPGKGATCCIQSLCINCQRMTQVEQDGAGADEEPSNAACGHESDDGRCQRCG
jgi:transcriptional regulator with XRE-family HTH domain